ncbi:hypothetical protein [Halobacterium zhouii]|uniref:hypothetical protein n=1 Tax=Halobacterium zhouii TaxID=2902624 RepID=UPI001E316C37|nr:hypothetical protein [Halobacterium zhouii]
MVVNTLDWVALVVPFVVYFLMLIVYYVWEGRREQRLREQYDETNTDETGEAHG